MASGMVLSRTKGREALSFGQSASLAATGLASWPSPQPPALAKQGSADPSHCRASSCRNPSTPGGCCLGTPLSHQSACYTGGAYSHL